MPGYVIHLAEAKLIEKTLFSENNNFRFDNWSSLEKGHWIKAFYYGVLLPDAVAKEKKALSHFWNPQNSGQVFQIPDLCSFHRNENVSLSNPVSCGYYAHLHLDRMFVTEYLPQFIEILDEKRRPTELESHAKNVYLKKQQKIISIEDFFSEEYLYGDYTKLNFALINNYQLTLPDKANLPDEEYCGVNILNLKSVLSDLDGYLRNSPTVNDKLSVFTLDSLDCHLKDVVKLLIKELINI